MDTATTKSGFEGYENVLDITDLDGDSAMMTTEAPNTVLGAVTDGDTATMTDAEMTDGLSISTASKNYTLTLRPAAPLYLTCDHDQLSEYQVLVRKQIELFEANDCDVSSNAQGRNRPITLGQVGIRCRHCAFVHPVERSKGAVYFPSKLTGVYQAAQNLAVSHLIDGCPYVPQNVRDELIRLRDQKSGAGGGKAAWAERTRALGVFEDADGLRFANRLDAFANELIPHH